MKGDAVVDVKVGQHHCYIYTGSRPFAADLPSIVFIHGGGLDHTVWNLLSRYFAHHGYNALAVDLPGHGRSGGALLDSIEAMAEWLTVVLDTLNISRAAVIGHSMGSLVALHAAGAHGARIDFAALIGVAMPMRVSDELLGAAENNDPAALAMVNLWGHGYQAQLGAGQAPGMWMTGSGLRLLERSANGVLFNDLSACNNYRQGLGMAARIQCPVQVLLGRQDLMAAPRQAKKLLDAIAGVQVHEFDPCGHMLMAEQPNQVLDTLISGLAKARTATARATGWHR